jgi:hypothetical protein
MALNVSNRCVEDAQAETGKAGTETSAEERDLVPCLVRLAPFSSPEPFSLGHSLKIRLWFTRPNGKI